MNSSEIPFQNLFEVKNYTVEEQTKTLFELLENDIYTEEDVQLIEENLQIATKAHEGQKRDEGPDYIIHPIEVAIEAAKHRENAEVISAGLLHDTREDTVLQHYNKQKLRSMLQGQTIELLTKLLSKIRNEEKLDGEDYGKNLQKDRRSVNLKGYDRKTNLRSFGRMATLIPDVDLEKSEKSDKIKKRIEKQIRETRESIIPMLEDFNMALAAEVRELNDKLERRLHFIVESL